MLTDSDIKRLKEAFKEDFATKDDLKRFATKDDLKAMEKRSIARFATKDDLRDMEKRSIARFATKDDLKTTEARSTARFATKEDLFKAVKELIELINSVSNSLGERIDSLTEEVRSINKRLDLILPNHEMRIKRLENEVLA